MLCYEHRYRYAQQGAVSSNGKVLLAYLPAEERSRLLSRPLVRFTLRTITHRLTLEKQLRRVVQDGYASTLEELELGLNAVAAPCTGRTGRTGRTERLVPLSASRGHRTG